MIFGKTTAIVLVLTSAIVGPVNPARGETGNTLTLDAAIVRALNTDPGLRARAAGVAAAEANIRQAGVRPNPIAGLEAENFAGSGPASDFNAAEFTLSVQQRIERGGKRQARIGLAKRKSSVAQALVRTSRLDVIYEVQKAHIGALAAEAMVENARKRAQLATDLSQSVKSRVDVGRDPQAAKYRAEVQEMAAQTDLDQAHRARDIAKVGLAALWGSFDTDFDLEAAGLFTIGFSAERPGREGLGGSPDLVVLEAARGRAGAAVVLAVAVGVQDPTVSVGVRQFQDTDDIAGVLGVSVPLPLFNTNRGNIERANAEKIQAEWQLAAVRRDLTRRLVTLGHTLRAAREESTSLRERLIPQAEKVGRLTRQGYETGAFTYLEVLEAQRVVSDLRSRQVAALKTYHVTQAGIDRLTGWFAAPLPGEEHAP